MSICISANKSLKPLTIANTLRASKSRCADPCSLPFNRDNLIVWHGPFIFRLSALEWIENPDSVEILTVIEVFGI